MASESAWALGAQIGQNRATEQRQRKEFLADEERQNKVADLYGKGHALAQTIPSLTGDARDKAMSQLADVEGQIRDIYHPVKNPGALQRDWDHLAGLIRRKPRPTPVTNITSTGEPGVSGLSTPFSVEGPVIPPTTSTYSVAGPVPYEPSVTSAEFPAMKLPTAQQTIAAAPMPAYAKVKPGTTGFNVSAPYGRQQMQKRDAAMKTAELDVAAAGLSPEQQSAQTMTSIRRALRDYDAERQAAGLPPATSAEKSQFLGDLLSKAYGVTPPKEKYFSQIVTTKDTDGTEHYWRVPQDSTMSPEEVDFNGQQMVPKTTARGGGSDFWKTVTAKYGPNPTAEQIEAERQRWIMAGAHGTVSRTTVDAAGNSVTVRDPSFAPGQQVPPELIAPSADTGAGAAGAGAASPFASAISAAEGFGIPGTIPTRANNPGALELGDVGYGTLRAANGQQITVFGSPEDGQAALDRQLNLIFSGGSQKYSPDMTLAEFGKVYSGGDVNYGSRIAASLGVDPKTTLGQLQGAKMRPLAGAGAGGAVEAPVSTAAPPPPTPVSPQQEQTLTSLGLTPPDDPLIVSPDSDDAQAALAEAARLGIDKDVQAVADYRLNPNQVTAARGGQKTKFMQLVQRVNPAYDATKWEAVQQARKSFTAGGQDARNMNSLGLSVNHLDKLVTNYNALENTRLPDYNKMRNAAKVHTGYGGVAAVDSAANAVSGEMATVFKNTSGTDQEIQSWREQFDHNMAPEAFQGSIETMTDLMAGRMVQEAQNYVNTFGTLKGFPLLSPKTAKILKGIGTEGANLMLRVNREAADASGIKLPVDDDDQPTTAPAQTVQASGATSPAGTGGTKNRPAPGRPRRFKVGTDTYTVPPGDVQGFLKDNPNAQELK